MKMFVTKYFLKKTGISVFLRAVVVGFVESSKGG